MGVQPNHELEVALIRVRSTALAHVVGRRLAEVKSSDYHLRGLLIRQVNARNISNNNNNNNNSSHNNNSNNIINKLIMSGASHAGSQLYSNIRHGSKYFTAWFTLLQPVLGI